MIYFVGVAVDDEDDVELLVVICDSLDRSVVRLERVALETGSDEGSCGSSTALSGLPLGSIENTGKSGILKIPGGPLPPGKFAVGKPLITRPAPPVDPPHLGPHPTRTGRTVGRPIPGKVVVSAVLLVHAS